MNKKNGRKANDFEFLEKKLLLYITDLKKFIFTLVKDDMEAYEEILQATVMAAYKNLRMLRNPSRIKAWTFNIAKSEASHYYKIRSNNHNEDKLRYLHNQPKKAQRDTLDLVIEAESERELRNLIKKLDHKYYRIIVLHYYYGIGLKEISKIYNINYSTVRTNHKRSIEKMRELFEEADA